MRPRHAALTRSIFPALLASTYAFHSPAAHAANGTWTSPASGLWSASSNWSSGIIANGSDAVADFSALNLTSNLSVHLDSSRSIGTLLFADKSVNDHNWTLDNNGSKINFLLLDVSAGTPVISVANALTTVDLILSGSKGLEKKGVGTLLLNFAASYTGNTTLSAGRILSGTNNALPAATSLNLAPNTSFDLNGHTQSLASLTGNGTISNPATLANLTISPAAGTDSSQNLITGNINLIKSGAGTLFLGTTPNTYTGATHITAGVLVITGPDVLPTSTALTVDAGATFDPSIQSQTIGSLSGTGTVRPSFLVGSRGTLTIKSGGIQTVPTLLAGHMNFVQDGGGFITLTTPATYDGSTTIANGFFFCGVDNALPATTVLDITNVNALDLNGHNQQVALLSGTGSVTNQSATPATFTLAPPSLTPSTVSNSFFGNLSFNLATNASVTLSTAALYTGNTSISAPAATLISGVANAIPVTSPLALAGTFNLNGFDQQLPSVSGNGTITNTSAAKTSSFQLNTPADTSLAALVTGNIDFSKTGPARLLLNRALTYTGSTTLQQGTLALGVDNALPAATSLFMNPATTLDLNGHSLQLASLAGAGAIVDSVSSNLTFTSLNIECNTDVLTFTTINGPLLHLGKGGNGTLFFGSQVIAGLSFFNSGNVQFNSQNNQIAILQGNGQVIISPGASLSVADINCFSAVVDGTLNITPSLPNATSVFADPSIAQLSVAGSTDNWTGRLNLDNETLILSKFFSDPATIQNLAAFGRTHNAGITSTNLPDHFALAFIDNAIAQLQTFHGHNVNSNVTILSPELLGDANLDGKVDLSDLSTILNHFGTTTLNWTDGNFDDAPTIDLTDLSFVLNNFGLTNPSPFSQLPFTSSQLPTTPAPEPAALSLLLALPLLLKRRPHPSH